MKPTHLPPTTVLKPDSFDEIFDSLRRGLPPPPTDDPEAMIRRDNDAMAQVISMRPANAAEAQLAVLCVIASAQAMYSLSLINEKGADAFKCRAAFIKMTRQSLSNRSLLLRIQAAREMIADSQAAAASAKRAEQIALYHMTNALREKKERAEATSVPRDTTHGSNAPNPNPPAGSPETNAPAEAVPPARFEFRFETSSQRTMDESTVILGKRVLH